MYSQENYIWGLLGYFLGVLLVMPAMFKVTGFIMPWKPLRILLRLFFIALLVTPAYAYNDASFLAPAWIVAFFETVRPTSPEGPALAYAVLATAFITLILLTVGFYVARYYWRKKLETSDGGEELGEAVEPPA